MQAPRVLALALLAGVNSQQDNTYWGSYDLTIPGGSGAGNAVKLLSLPENAPSFFDFQAFRSAPVPVPESIQLQQRPPVQQSIPQPNPAPQPAPQFRLQQQQPREQQQLRQQPRQQEQFRSQPQLRVQPRPQQQQLRVQTRPQAQQSNTGFQVQSSLVKEFLPANGQEAQQIRQQIANGNFNFQQQPAVPQPAQQQQIARPAPRPAPRRLAPRPAPRPAPQAPRPTPQAAPQQSGSRFNSFPQQQSPVQQQPQRQQPQTLEQQLRVFAPQPAVAQQHPQPEQPQQTRFSNFRANPLRSRARGAVDATPAPVRAVAPAPAPVPSPPQFEAAPLRPTPAADEVFNDYDSGEHRLSRFQLFQLKKKQEKLAGTGVATVETPAVETNQVQVEARPQELQGKQKVVAVRRKKVRG